jgi:hypothetical protein
MKKLVSSFLLMWGISSMIESKGKEGVGRATIGAALILDSLTEDKKD